MPTKAAKSLTPGQKREQAIKQANARLSNTRTKAARYAQELADIKRAMESKKSKKGRVVNAIPEQPKLKEALSDHVIFQPNEGPQTEFLSAGEDDVLYGGAAGGGKVVQKGDKISTPFGWKKVEELKVGDLITNPEGGVQKIVQLHPWQLYKPTRVCFSDGTHVDVHEEHLWQAWRAGKSVKHNGKRVFGRESAEVVETRTLRDWIDRGYNPQIPVTQPVVYNNTTKEKDRIGGYLLGVLLGDGCITTKNVTITAHEDDHPHLKKKLGYGDDVVYKGQTIRFRGKTRKWLVDKLKLHKLLGTRSADKYIPHTYLYGPLEERWELVRGLMDTDGYSAPDKNSSYYTTISKQLAEDVAHLLRGLGCVVTIGTKKGKYRKDGEVVECSLVYELYIKSRKDSDLFSLERKKTLRGEKEISKRVVSVEMLDDVVWGRCITVSSPSGLYVTEDYIVTHNSYAMIVDPLRYCHIKDHRALIIRKTMPELRELIDKTRELYPQAFPGAKYHQTDKRWTFPSGATIEFGYLEKDADVYRYQGQAFSWIGFDEITHLATEFPWNYLASRLRTTNPDITCYLRCTANPGGIGHSWVKKRYIEPYEWNKSFRGADGLTRRFIPAKLSDNPYLHKDGRYQKMLESLPEVHKKRLLEGDWDVSEGAAFPEFSKDDHIIAPFTIPANWNRVKAVDYGYSSPSAVVWAAIDPEDGTVVVYRELYQKGLTGLDLAKRMVEMESDEHRSISGVLDTAAWNQTGTTGPTVGEALTRGYYGHKLRRADKNRVAGKVQIHEHLKKDERTGKPKLLIFATCPNLIRELSSIPADKNNPEDVDTNADDHAYDALRYLLMSRPKRIDMNTFMFDVKRELLTGIDPTFHPDI